MRRNDFILVLVLIISTNGFKPLNAQEDPSEKKIITEEESAEVFLEEYTDEFQETFFEALKQKGIENFDRAINLLLECKNLEPFNPTVDHELAKAYYLNKQYIPSQEYAENALTRDPENFWFLNTWVQSVEKQSNTVDALKNTIPYENEILKKNLTLIYFKNKKYQVALAELKQLKKSDFKDDLTQKINDSLQKSDEAVVEKGTTTKKEMKTVNPTDILKKELEGHIKEGQYKLLAEKAERAIESYPLQPYFYYAYGLALNNTNQPNKAAEVLLTSLDYLFDDDGLSNKIYRELANAYNALGNVSKANEYLSKIKSGS